MITGKTNIKGPFYHNKHGDILTTSYNCFSKGIFLEKNTTSSFLINGF